MNTSTMSVDSTTSSTASSMPESPFIPTIPTDKQLQHENMNGPFLLDSPNVESDDSFSIPSCLSVFDRSSTNQENNRPSTDSLKMLIPEPMLNSTPKSQVARRPLKRHNSNHQDPYKTEATPASSCNSDNKCKEEQMEMSPCIPTKDSTRKIMDAVDKSNQDMDLIGDFSRSHLLPLIHGKHHDLRTITPDTLAKLMRGYVQPSQSKIDNIDNDLVTEFTVVDCRYPYEFEGGHIRGAQNVYTYDDLLSKFFAANKCDGFKKCGSQIVESSTKPSSCDNNNVRRVVIFHCEFSSKRAPRLYRSMRKFDRSQNCYPNLKFPEIYLLEGGYKAFYAAYPELCEPSGYSTMESDLEQFKHYEAIRAKSFVGTGTEASVVGKTFRPSRSRGVKRSNLGFKDIE